MKKEIRKNLDFTINELESFLEKDFSSRFKALSHREDRQLFFLASVLTRLKSLSNEIKEEEKILIFPTLREPVNS
jgi:molybdopterin converting factor small subunit